MYPLLIYLLKLNLNNEFFEKIIFSRAPKNFANKNSDFKHTCTLFGWV